VLIPTLLDHAYVLNHPLEYYGVYERVIIPGDYVADNTVTYKVHLRSLIYLQILVGWEVPKMARLRGNHNKEKGGRQNIGASLEKLL
jgi:hypothetical protein